MSRRALPLLALLLGGCVMAGQEIRVTQHWNTAVSKLAQVEMREQGLLVIRNTAVRTARELYSQEGLLERQAFSDRPIVRVLEDRDLVYAIERVSDNWTVITRSSFGGAPEQVAREADWTELLHNERGDVLAFESLYASRNVSPCGLRIRNLTLGRVEFEDQFAYHHPVATRRLLLASPIDRVVRRYTGGRTEDVGRLIQIERLPVVSHDRVHAAWFGPHAEGSALYVAGEHGAARVLKAPFSERVIAFLGADVLVPEEDSLTGRWVLIRYSLTDGARQGEVIPVPADVTPTELVGSPRGDYLGLPWDRGSMLVRASDGYSQKFEGVPLSAWHFSAAGDRLYLVTDDRLQIVALK